MKPTARAFTLIELLIVVAIVAVLAAIATVNLRQATERARKSADAANLKAIAAGLQNYLVDWNALPPADHEAGPFPSHGPTFTDVGNAPAAGGSWDAVPWLLVERGYVSDWRTLFCPKYLALYNGGQTLRGGHPRFHNFRYAYNAASVATGGLHGGTGNIMTGEVWILRNLYVPATSGFYAAKAPKYPADYTFPWGEGDQEGTLEHAVYADFAVKTVIGGTDDPPAD